MRVLWVFDYLSASYQQVAQLVAQRAYVDLEILCRWNEAPPLASTQIPVRYLHCRSKLDFAAQRRLREQLRDGKYDLVHAYTSRNLATVVGACRGWRARPKIVGYRGTVSRLHWHDPANWITFWHPRVDRVICVSGATERALLDSRIAPRKLSVVREGCSPERLPTPPRSARREFQIPEDAFVVGTVATIRPVKGIDLLLEAALQLTGYRDMYWLLIGSVDDPRVTKLAADPRIADRVRLAGPRPGAGHLAGLFDVYASPSRMEGLGMAVIEAMAQRVCPLVSAAGGLPELVEHEGNGLIVPVNDVPAITAGIRRLYQDVYLRRQMADAAYQRALTEFSIEAWTARLLDVYADVVGTKVRAEKKANPRAA